MMVFKVHFSTFNLKKLIKISKLNVFNILKIFIVKNIEFTDHELGIIDFSS